MNKLVFSLLFAFALTVPLGYAVPAFAITLTQISTPFPSPIGIDHHEEGATDRVAISVNYNTGGNPHALRLVDALGNQVQFSALSGVSDEVKIATVRSGNTGGFTVGDLFVGNGVDGQVVRVSSDGTTITNPWADLPGVGNGLMRGSLYVDRTGVYGDDLIVVTTAGEVWRIDSTGSGTMIADVNTHLEGVVTVPNNAAQYGPLAGKIIAGAEGLGLLFVFDSTGFVATHSLGVLIEDIDHITGTENFYGVNFGTSRLLGAPASDFAPYAGEILLTQEFPSGNSGLFHLSWNGLSLQALPIPATVTTGSIGQWEHVTFSSAGIVEIPPVEDEVIGGEIIPIDSAVLILAGIQTNYSILTLLGIAAVGAGFTAFTLRRK